MYDSDEIMYSNKRHRSLECRSIATSKLKPHPDQDKRLLLNIYVSIVDHILDKTGISHINSYAVFKYS